MKINAVNESFYNKTIYEINNTNHLEQEALRQKSNSGALKRKLRAEALYQANIQALSTPTEVEILKFDLNEIELMLNDFFKFVFGPKVSKRDCFKTMVKIAQAEYLVEKQTDSAYKLLDELGLTKYLNQEEPEINLSPVRGMTERKMYVKFLDLIETFEKNHYKFVSGPGAENSQECQFEIKKAQAEFLIEEAIEGSEVANDLLNERDLWAWV